MSAICFPAACMSRGSELMDRMCRLCVTMGDACGAERGKHTHMEHGRVRAGACRRCAERSAGRDA